MKQGDIVPIAFPFSDLSARKMRPALVLSNDSYNKHRNLILAGIYGKKKPHSIPITNAELIRKKLNKDPFISLPAGTAQEVSGNLIGTSQLTVEQDGNYEVQCRVCKDAEGKKCTDFGKNK